MMTGSRRLHQQANQSHCSIAFPHAYNNNQITVLRSDGVNFKDMTHEAKAKAKAKAKAMTHKAKAKAKAMTHEAKAKAKAKAKAMTHKAKAKAKAKAMTHKAKAKAKDLTLRRHLYCNVNINKQQAYN